MMDFEPGIFFGLPAEDYHSVPALSNTGIKNLLMSPMDFWARSWMNPDYEREESDAMELGTAYHTRILEGRAVFQASYAAMLEPTDYPDALRTTDDIKAALIDLDPKAKKGGSKAELIDRLLELDPSVQVWDRLTNDHMKANEGKSLLAHKTIKRIEIAAAMIENHPQLGKVFTGGYPEVSIFWADPETSVPMKMRADYLKLMAIADLKTYANQQEKPVDRAVIMSMATRKYHIQTTVYCEGIEAAKSLPAFGDVDQDWLKKFRAAPLSTFLFVFQQTGVAPVARGYVFPRGLVFDCGKVSVNQARETYKFYLEAFGTDPWIDTTPIRTFEDSEFPAFMTD